MDVNYGIYDNKAGHFSLNYIYYENITQKSMLTYNQYLDCFTPISIICTVEHSACDVGDVCQIYILAKDDIGIFNLR